MGELETYLTSRQLTVLRLLSQGKTVDEIASLLGVSKSDVYSLMRSAKRVIHKSINTINLYNQIMNNSSMIIHRGITINDLIFRILSEADNLNMKIPLTTADLILRLIRSIDYECIDLVENRINCDLILHLNPGGKISFNKIT
ncbi:MAG: Tfx family DNA-binding protein [Sulfolobales archaeon]|nr:Tfx family DNA-binding protein [Sulfolobales archaeon]MDW7969320.1 Tfx family DNA-binding protein [Sulfolobales archaeon]